MSSPETARVICYVDGFNLYFGMKKAALKRFYWLDIQKLASCLINSSQVLVGTKYFTARIAGALPSDNPIVASAKNEKKSRQDRYLEAIETLPDLRVFEGHYLMKDVACRNCNTAFQQPEEKMTDVNIATELLMDAFLDRFDTAIVVSGDSDLVPPVKAVRRQFPQKKVLVAFPPMRSSSLLRQEATACLTIWRHSFKRSQLPETVERADGVVLTRPVEWR